MPSSVLQVIRVVRLGDQSNTSVDVATGVSTRTVQVWYLVEFDGLNWSELDAENALGVPALLDVYAPDTSCILRRKQARRDTQGPTVAKVQCEYSNAVTPRSGSGKSNVTISINPTSFEVNVTQGYASLTDPTLIPLQNAVGSPIVVRSTVTGSKTEISFNFGTYDQAASDACVDKVNDATVTMIVNGTTFVFPPYTMLYRAPRLAISDPTGEPPYLWKTGYLFDCNPNGWTLTVPNEDFWMVYDPSDPDTPLTRIVDSTGLNPAQKPQLLKADGTLLGADVVPTIGNGGLIEVVLYPATDFSSLLSDIAI